MACLFPTVRVQSWTPAEPKWPDVQPAELDVQSELKLGLDRPPSPPKTRVQVELQLHFDGPFLVNDPAKVCVVEAVEADIVRSGGERKAPDHVPRVAGTQLDKPQKKLTVKPLLPATGFKGPVRAQLERILKTIDPGIAVSPHGEPGEVNGEARDFVRALFGFEDQESGIWCSEFVGTDPGKIPVKREMVAIDRFTGGASEHAKFDVLCLDRPTLEGILAFDLPAGGNNAERAAAAKKAIGAVILLLRDLIEGDVSFGFGDMKGFGQCRAKIRSLAVAGLRQQSELAKEIEERIEQKTGSYDLNRWMTEVLDAVSTGCADERIANANDLLKVFLAAVRAVSEQESQPVGVKS
jgi:CRISPR/Cas system CSM-associated protein Csm3 (group 7 of RAMP superfamily)